MDDKTYEAIGMLLRGLVWHEQSGGRTPEHLAGQARRAIAMLSPEIAAEIEQDGPARVYAERWDDVTHRDDRSAQLAASTVAEVGMMAEARTPEMQARYDAAIARERGKWEQDFAAATARGQADYEAGRFTRFESAAAMSADLARLSPAPTNLCVTITGPRDRGTTLARAILKMLQEADVACSMPEETENPYDGDSIEQLGHFRGGARVIVQTGGVE